MNILGIIVECVNRYIHTYISNCIESLFIDKDLVDFTFRYIQ